VCAFLIGTLRTGVKVRFLQRCAREQADRRAFPPHPSVSQASCFPEEFPKLRLGFLRNSPARMSQLLPGCSILVYQGRWGRVRRLTADRMPGAK